ncbi:MAG: peptide deformylase [Lachnospiraceae bacterium]|nr:peptide deformylase [Lachnospiraceae bacterium]
MSERTVRQTGDEILRKQSKDVLELTDRLKELISDMKDTMKIHGGCGLAAVQVGVLKKIIICAPEEDKEPVVLINPEIVSVSDETEEDSEGCLSVDGYRGKVIRPKNIVVKAKDENMNDMEFDAEGFFARIICHEVDHLNGVLYTDKVVPGTLEDINKENDETEEET